jgi:hypothetical protein
MNEMKTYTWQEYLNRFDTILKQTNPTAPYDNPDYFNYLKLNESRQKRWLKKNTLNNEIKTKLLSIKEEQNWIIITEPWCGDAAHSIPFLKMMADINPLITLKFVWRDEPPFLIEEYLTNGGKSVPKLIVRNSNNKDLFTWGPRPKECQNLYLQLKEEKADFERMKIELQQWYNKDKGNTIQQEILDILSRP